MVVVVVVVVVVAAVVVRFRPIGLRTPKCVLLAKAYGGRVSPCKSTGGGCMGEKPRLSALADVVQGLEAGVSDSGSCRARKSGDLSIV